MATVTPHALVAAPAVQPLERGLFSVFNFRSSGDRFEAGVQWEPMGGCDPLDGIGPAQCEPLDDEGQPEIQMLTIEGPPTTGTWRVGYHGVFTAPLAITATALQVETAINTASPTSDVTVSGAAGGPYTVTSVDNRPFDLFITDDTFDIGGVEVDLVQQGVTPGGTFGLPKTLDGFDSPDGDALPFTVYADWVCSPVGYSPEAAQAQATTRLLRWEQARVEQAFWTGDLENVPNLSGANGYPPPLSAGVHDTDWHALAAVEDQLARLYGAQGVIHMSIRTASLLLSKGALDAKGSRLYTELGTPVVAGAGYPDTSEIVGTPALFGYRSEVFDSSDRRGDLFDRARNELRAIAERTYLIGFDPCPTVKASYTGVET